MSWSVAGDSSESAAAVFSEHELKVEQSCLSLKGRTPQNGAIIVSEQVKPHVIDIGDDNQKEDCGTKCTTSVSTLKTTTKNMLANS